MNWSIIQLFVLIALSTSLAPNEIVIFIISQPDKYHNQLANELRANLYNQSATITTTTSSTTTVDNQLINVYLLHEISNNPGYWTFMAILSEQKLTNIIDRMNTKWIILCEDRSTINLKILINELNRLDHNQIAYYGYPLYDQEATIIHHFAFFENPQWFPYPLLRSGVIFTSPLIKRLTKYVQEEKPTKDFFIDASHELSLFMWQNIRIEKVGLSNNNNNKNEEYTVDPSSGKSLNYSSNTAHNKNYSKTIIKTVDKDKIKMKIENESNYINENSIGNGRNNETEEPWKKLQMTTASILLCSNNETDGCAIYPNQNLQDCNSIRPEAIYFAIKTCHKFHKDRIRIIGSTWAQYAVHKTYFSDMSDDKIPTVSTGVPNTETGHCAKTLAILKLALNDISNLNRFSRDKNLPVIEWIFLSDDDTILSVSGVCEILGCFNSNDDIYLGERYGYRLHSNDGFNYITGGGGIIFSLSTAHKIITSCTCPVISSPDDMIIGVCLQRLNIKALHSSRFHQARPLDYSSKLLEIEQPISFHKFWQINPYDVYEKWFKNDDKNLQIINMKNKNNNNNKTKIKINDTGSKLKSKNENNIIKNNNCDIKDSNSNCNNNNNNNNVEIIKNFQNDGGNSDSDYESNRNKIMKKQQTNFERISTSKDLKNTKIIYEQHTEL